MKTIKRAKKLKIISFVLLAILVVLPALSLGASAKDGRTVVRVGWYECPFNQTDEFDRRTGYAYEYQQKIAAYTGWTYEYVYGSWSELLQMLVEGKIDLLSDVSFTEERSEHMLFSSLPMGEEEYYLFVSTDKAEKFSDNVSSLNGKKIGIYKDSVQAEFFKDWERENGVDAEIVELVCSNDEAIEKLRRGEIDGYVSLNYYYNYDGKNMAPICKVGSSDFSFAVSCERPELLEELNAAMSRIQNENPIYNHQLTEKYLVTAGVNYLLTSEEKSGSPSTERCAWAIRTTISRSAPRIKRRASSRER